MAAFYISTLSVYPVLKGRVAPERGGPSRERRPPRLSGAGKQRRRVRAVHIHRTSSRFSHPRSGLIKTAPLHGATPRGGVRATVRQRPPGKERGKSASGSAQEAAPSRSAAGKSATLKNPAHHQRSARIALPLAPCDRYRQAETPKAAR